MIGSGVTLVNTRFPRVSISELKNSIAAQNNLGQLHNRRIFTETCSPEVVSGRRTRRRVRKFVDELMYKPEVGKFYLEAKERFELPFALDEETLLRMQITDRQSRNVADFIRAHEMRDRLGLGTEEDVARRLNADLQMRRLAEFVRANNQQGGYRQTKKRKRNYRMSKLKSKSKSKSRSNSKSK